MSDILYKEIKPGVHHIHKPLEEGAFTSYELIYTAGGTWYDPEDRWGEGHLTEHTQLCTVDERTQQEYRADIADHLIEINGVTGPLSMDIWIEGHRKFTPRLWTNFLILALNPVIRNELLEQEKAIVLGEIAEKHGSLEYQLRQFIGQTLFEPGSYGIKEMRGTLGTDRTVGRMDIQNIRDRVSRNLKNSHLIFASIGGDLEFDELNAEIDKYTEKINPEPVDPITFWPESGFKPFSTLPIIHPLAPDGAVLNIYLPVPITLENTPERILLFGHLNKLIFQKLRLDLGLIYNFGASLKENDQLVEFNTVCSMKHVQVVIDSLKDLLVSGRARLDDALLEKLKERNNIYMDLHYSDKQEFSYVLSNFQIYGQLVSSRDVSQQIAQTTLEQVNGLVDTLAENIPHMRIVGLSKDKDIKLALNGKVLQETGRGLFRGFGFGGLFGR